ncbi:MAG: efflux RND transporter permease subunit, partial [Gammaproteobacteria bacterium]|nr:efflux RND transporter permease subunit [Gammaproteobacteria bacterium]
MSERVPETVPSAGVRALRGGGVSAWSIRHPVGVTMIALAVVVLGLFALGRLSVDLLPHIIYPEVRVRIVDPGVPSKIMEDKVTRQLEEQLAITEDAISVQSATSEGRSEVDLTFEYGKDIDIALRDASSRLDRAKRFLPDTIDPPIIYKRDPSQIPVMEFVISSKLRDPTELRTWIDYVFAKWFLNLRGVAAVEIGGAPLREILVMPDQQRLAGHGLSLDDVMDALRQGNVETAGGALRMARQELNSRTSGRFRRVESIAEMPLTVEGSGSSAAIVRLKDIAEVVDGHQDEKVRIRLNRSPGVKVSIQKQPQANTVEVVDAVKAQLAWLAAERLLPDDVAIDAVADQSIFVRQSLANATSAAVAGGLLAMLVVYLFLGDLRRTLIIGTGIPIAIMVAAVVMAVTGLTINIMTLGGLALGVGMLVDNTIVMLENIYRHQRGGSSKLEAAIEAAAEVNSPIIASTSTNLAAVLPFLFIGGLVGLLFRELIVTISAAIAASLLVAITLVPALGARVPVSAPGPLRRGIDYVMESCQNTYAKLVSWVLKAPWLVPIPFVVGLALAVPTFYTDKQVFLPEVDDGKINADIVADAGISLDEMDRTVARLETLFLNQPEVETAFSQIGGFVFGRSEYERTNRARISLQLVPVGERDMTSTEWITRVKRKVDALQLAGVQVRMRNVGIRGFRMSRGDDDLSIRVQGPNLDKLAEIGEAVVARLKDVPGLKNVRHSSEDIVQELSVGVDRERAAGLGLDIESVGQAVRVALQGVVVTDFIDEDQQFDIRVRLPRRELTSPRDVESILLFPGLDGRNPVYLRDVATVELVISPADIRRDHQQRIIEVSGNIGDGATLGEVSRIVTERLDGFELPSGYTLYDGGAALALKQGEELSRILVGLALFLVLVVMAVQYESLRNPFIILLSVPASLIGVAIGVHALSMPISMPLWLGLIMLAGIVVNNAIVLVEYIEIARERGMEMTQAIVEAARVRLRPILMTTLTTVMGMLPLAIGLGEGSELLQPLAVAIACGLSFSTLVSLLLVPAIYRLLG